MVKTSKTMKKQKAPKPPKGRSIVSEDVKKKEKKIRIVGFIILIICELSIVALMFTSCTEDSTRDKCAILDQGTVLVRNSSETALIVDVTHSGLGINNPITLHYLDNAINLTYFQEIPRGRAVVWWRTDGEEWQHAFVEVESCQETYFVITNDL